MNHSGSVSGAGSLPVALEKQDWPYSGPYVQIATANVNGVAVTGLPGSKTLSATSAAPLEIYRDLMPGWLALIRPLCDSIAVLRASARKRSTTS